MLANARYWSSVAPLARAQLSRWQARAEAIPDIRLMTLATGKLRDERFNVEVATTLATLAPRAQRECAVEAIVALQAMYDYLDVLTERPVAKELWAEPTDDGWHLYGALIDAVAVNAEPVGNYYRDHPDSCDGGYLRELVETVRLALSRLPANAAIVEVARHAAERCAEAQLRGHAAAPTGTGPLERWARREATDTALGWREWLAGAQASVLCLHALIAAAAWEHTTREDARALDATYLSIGALTMLDSLIDRERDLADGTPTYADLYNDPEQMGRCLSVLARAAAAETGALPHAAHHTMTLAGVVAYYASAPSAREPLTRPAFDGVRRELRPLIVATLSVMHSWRLAKVAHIRLRTRPQVFKLWSTDRGRG